MRERSSSLRHDTVNWCARRRNANKTDGRYADNDNGNASSIGGLRGLVIYQVLSAAIKVTVYRLLLHGNGQDPGDLDRTK